jgi:hypothetical protein
MSDLPPQDSTDSAQPKNLAQFDSLLHAYVDQTLTRAELEQLENILRVQPEARRRLVDLLALDSALLVDNALTADAPATQIDLLNTETSHTQNLDVESMSITIADKATCHLRHPEADHVVTTTTRYRRLTIALVAIAATIVLIFSWPYIESANPSASDSTVWLEVLEVNNLQLSSAQPAWNAGERVQLTDLKIDAGEVDVKLDSGVTLSLEGPFSARFENSAAMQLYHGKMSADVAEKGKGFTVRTATSEVVDLGTRFGISAKTDGETDVVVFEGEVKVRRQNTRSKNEAWTTLRSGEAVRVAKQKELQRLARVRLSKNRKLWSSQTSNPSSLVVDVEDSATEPEFLHYLGVVPQGMGVDSQPFSDRPQAKWQAMPGESFPQELESADLIRTFLADRGDRELEIRIQVSRPCIMYVIMDDRRPPPQWLEKEFIKTTQSIRVGPWPANSMKELTADDAGRVYVPCSIWKCHIDRAGVFVLGSPFVKGSKNQSLMYGLAVGPIETLNSKP